MDKQEIINKVYTDPAGFGSKKETLKDARQIDKEINMNDINKYFSNNLERKTQLKGYNSFVADEPYEEYQIDLLFFSDLKDPIYTNAMLCVDIFSKFVSMVPLKNKKIPDCLEGTKECFKRMGKKPQVLYTDDEGALNSNEIQKYLKDIDVKHIVTRTHAAVAERTIRTIKKMIYTRIEQSKEEPKPSWHSLIYPVVLTYNYKLKSSVTKMTPVEARKPQNKIAVKWNLELKARFTRKYPAIKEGDYVKLYKKKDKLDKERKSVWTDKKFKVEDIIEDIGQEFYKIETYTRTFLRHELLLVS